MYFEDPYQTEFDSAVIERLDVEGRPALILERTAFYPEGGGQPADRGMIEGVEVVDVQESEGVILHILADKVETDPVRGHVDYVRRFDHMQQHAGQHVLSQVFWRELKGETRSFHLGEEVSSLEIGIGKISEKELDRIEAGANAVVFQNKEIRCYFVPEDKKADVPLRRPPKVTGTIRVVEIEEWEYSACGGTHPRRTGEIGLIKILSSGKIRGNLRFTFVCGARALREFTVKTRILGDAAGRFSAAEADVPGAIDKLFAEAKESKRALRKLRERAAEWEAETMTRKAASPVFSRLFRDRSLEEVKMLALSLIRHPACVVIFGVALEERAHLILARSEDVDLDMRERIAELSPLINGRGGGRPSLVELAGSAHGGLEEALRRATDYFEGILAGQ